jgi:electron transport complex protein RnfG
LKPALTLFIISVFTIAALSAVYTFTLEPIAAQKSKAQQAAMAEVLSKADEYRVKTVQTSGSIVNVYEGISGGRVVGYVVELSKDGYGGKIDMMVGISAAEEKLTGMRVVKHSETPGLGALIVRENFYRKFDGRPLSPIRVVKTSPAANEIDAITASTISSKAVTDAVNEAIAWYNGGGWR